MPRSRGGPPLWAAEHELHPARYTDLASESPAWEGIHAEEDNSPSVLWPDTDSDFGFDDVHAAERRREQAKAWSLLDDPSARTASGSQYTSQDSDDDSGSWESQALCAAPMDQPASAPGRRDLFPTLLGRVSGKKRDAARKDRPEERVQDQSIIAPEELTTVMLQNLPRLLTQPQLLNLLRESGFGDVFDFCFLPRPFGVTESQGFAFVNFVSAHWAESFAAAWHGKVVQAPEKGNHSQAVKIVPAMVQGLQANLARWATPRLRRIRNPEYHPFVQLWDPARAPTEVPVARVAEGKNSKSNGPAPRARRRNLPAATAVTARYADGGRWHR